MRECEKYWLMNHKKIFTGSLLLSLLLHLLALLCIQRYSAWFSSQEEAKNSENWLSLVEKKERDQILKSTFDLMVENETKERFTNTPHFEEAPLLSLKAPIQITEPEKYQSIFFQFAFPANEPLLTSPILPTFSFPSQTFNLLDHLPKDLIVPPSTQQTHPIFHPLPANSSLTISSKTPKASEEPPLAPVNYPDRLESSLTEAPQVSKAPALIPMPNLPKLPTLAELDTSSYSDSFDADLVFLPREDDKGYVFALTLIPRPDLNLPKLNQHITFLIDRSNSIQQGRLSATKAAVHKSLEELSFGDSFNIIAFDSKMEKMSPNNLPCLGRSYALAEAFLEKIQLGSFFSSGDLFKPLFLTVPGSVNQDEVHTAILLTDGETLGKKAAQRSLLHDWTAYNSGKVSLFVIGMNDAHLATLDAAAVFNRGKAINAPTNRGLKRKLSKLIKNIQNPVAKNISCHAISRSPNSKIQLFAKPSQTPHLYLDQPYVILGQTDTLDDFILFVQGRLKGRWLNIKKTVSFLNARKGNKSLKQEFALQQAYELYEQYVIDEDPKHIAEAEKLLGPYEYRVAFQ
jgi:hypothetical protein